MWSPYVMPLDLNETRSDCIFSLWYNLLQIPRSTSGKLAEFHICIDIIIHSTTSHKCSFDCTDRHCSHSNWWYVACMRQHNLCTLNCHATSRLSVVPLQSTHKNGLIYTGASACACLYAHQQSNIITKHFVINFNKLAANKVKLSDTENQIVFLFAFCVRTNIRESAM